jgi:hypothetical protein
VFRRGLQPPRPAQRQPPLCALRSRIERFINHLKNSRRVATRHDKTAGSTIRWDLDVLDGDFPIADEEKRTLLGARSVLLFVEGEDRSLNMALYRILFPTVTVAVHDGSRAVEAAVRSLRAIETLHWLDAFGIVDRDGRSEEEVARLRAEGIHVLPVPTVESLYYHPQAIRLVAERQAAIFGCDGSEWAAEAESRALAALKERRAHLIEARCRSALEQQVLASLRQKERPWQSSEITLQVHPAAMLAREGARFDELMGSKDLVGLAGNSHRGGGLVG